VRPKRAAEDAPWTESEPIAVYAGEASAEAVIELPVR
jgi:hypothetical protein